MKKHLYKIGALVLAAMVVFALGVVAWADDDPEPTRSGQTGSDTALTLSGSGTSWSVELNKEIKASGEGTIYAPNLTYTYTQVGEAETISGALTGSVAPTIGQSGSVATITFSNSQDATSGNVFSSSSSISIDTTGATAGAYKYTIQETCDAKTDKGITTGGTANYNQYRYLVVYVNSAHEVTLVNLYTDTSRTNKTVGWMASGSADNYDLYETVKLTVKKVITGSHAELNHEFPFTITCNFDNGSKVTLNNTEHPMTDTLSANLSHNEEAVIYGVPKNISTTFTIHETINTYDAYTVTTSGLQQDLTGAEPVNSGTTAGGTTPNITADTTVTFTNHLPDISATGLVLRVAPYVAMAAVGIPLFVVMTRRRKETAR